MKKIELLAPAGNMESLKAAVMAGCDAVYLGGYKFGARAFSKNFNNEELIEAINYCHLYNVKVYVTVNTLIYENEVEEFLKYVEFIHKNNVDALIIQDLGMFDLVHKTYPNLELHASTQMHIHNLDGTKLMEKLGMHRVVLARETSIDEIKHIKENTNIELEIFIHGALCISYSGQCLMSSLIGGRSGNRGACAGSCRLKYDVIDEEGNKLNKDSYPLSTKDLNSLENIGTLIASGVSSLKIEGRMKSPEYVYTVVSLYRKAIDSYYQTNKVTIDEQELYNLKKIFNRYFTKGFLFNTENNDLINGYRPNHMGVPVGEVIDYMRGIARIKLTDKISIGCGLRVINKKGDVGIIANDFYIGSRLVKHAIPDDVISIKVNSEVSIGDKVVLTTDSALIEEIKDKIANQPRKVSITGKFTSHLNEPTTLTITDSQNEITVKGPSPEPSQKRPITKDTIIEKLSKLGDTIYTFDNLEIDIDENLFLPIKEINHLRQLATDKLNQSRQYQIPFKKEKYQINVPDFPQQRLTTCLIDKPEKLKTLDKKYKIIYSETKLENTIQKLPRVIIDYPEITEPFLVGEIGALNKLSQKDKNKSLKNIDTDFSLNVTNSYTVAFLHSLGVNKITLSYELTDDQIKDLITAYKNRYHKHPNLEIIVSANEEVMISKFSLNKYYNQDNLYLKDMFKNHYKVVTKNNLMYIYNYKRRNLDETTYHDLGINSIRYNFDN